MTRPFVAALVVSVIQENLEALAIGAAASGPAIIVASGCTAANPAPHSSGSPPDLGRAPPASVSA